MEEIIQKFVCFELTSWLSWWRHLMPNLTTWVQWAESTWGKARTNSPKLYLDPHRSTMGETRSRGHSYESDLCWGASSSEAFPNLTHKSSNDSVNTYPGRVLTILTTLNTWLHSNKQKKMYILGTEPLNPLDAFEGCVPPGIPEEHFSSTL